MAKIKKGESVQGNGVVEKDSVAFRHQSKEKEKQRNSQRENKKEGTVIQKDIEETKTKENTENENRRDSEENIPFFFRLTPEELEQRKQIVPPSELPQSTSFLISPLTGAHIYLIGTAHVSQTSAQEVSQVIHKVRPAGVALELCRSRIGILHTPDDVDAYVNTSWADTLKMLRAAKGTSGILQLLLSNLFKSVVKQVKVMPGSEFKSAATAAVDINAAIFLVDRPINITLSRTWKSLSLWEKTKLIYYIISEGSFEIKEEDIERFKNSDILTQMIQEVSTTFPSLLHPIITERDMYLASQIRKCQGDRVVAVVGMGHVEGIKKYWTEPIDEKELMHIPQSYPWFSLIWKGAFGLIATSMVYYLCKGVFSSISSFF